MTGNRIIVYTDGACSGNPGPGGWGAIILQPPDRVRELGGGEPQTTNNRMEMIATIEALGALAEVPGTIELYTDSTYVIHGVTEWVAGWKRKGWKRADGGAVLNKDLWILLDALDEARRGENPIEWRYVRGHSGTPGNERCDVIAVSFSKKTKIALYDGPASGYAFDLAIRPPSSVARTSAGAASKSAGKAAAPKGKPVYLSLVGGKLERHTSWTECERRVKGQPNARYRKASSPLEEAEILRGWGIATGIAGN